MKTQAVTPIMTQSPVPGVARSWLTKSLDIVDALSTGRAAKEAYDAQVARGADPTNAVREVFARAA